MLLKAPFIHALCPLFHSQLFLFPLFFSDTARNRLATLMVTLFGLDCKQSVSFPSVRRENTNVNYRDRAASYEKCERGEKENERVGFFLSRLIPSFFPQICMISFFRSRVAFQEQKLTGLKEV